ncbi:MAG: DUF4126 family protein [Acidobacteriota bacterium]|nr:DUF4126 family protein [Acidobacteriota bacterium]
MATEMVSWMLAIPLLGFATGLRTMTPMAVLCWYSWLRALPVEGTWAFWVGKLVTAVVFTVLAAGELIADKLPQTPSRVSAFPLAARLVFGGLVGAISAISLEGPGLEGVVLGVVGAAIGAFVGFMLRRHLVSSFDCADWKIAVPEDLIAIVCALFAAHVITN